MRRALGAACIAASVTSCALLIDLQDRELASDASSDGGSSSDVIGADALDADVIACDADTDADSENCGRCDHSCQGTSCRDGKCEIVSLASTVTNPTAIAVTNGDVYWVESGNPPLDGGVFLGEVWHLPSDGGAPAAIYKDSFGAVDSVAALSGTAFWVTEVSSTDTSVRSMQGPYCTMAGVRPRANLAVAPHVVYGDKSGGASVACLDDGGTIPMAFVARNDHVGAIATSGNAAAVSVEHPFVGTGAFFDVCPDGISNLSTCVELSSFGGGQRAPELAALSPSNAFWAYALQSSVFRHARAAGASDEEYKLGDKAIALAADDQGIFVVTSDGTNLTGVTSFSCNASSCENGSSLVADAVTAVAIDDKFVYLAIARPLTDGGFSGQIEKTARP